MLSYEARDYIDQIWSGTQACERNAKYHPVNSPSDACLSFACGMLIFFTI